MALTCDEVRNEILQRTIDRVRLQRARPIVMIYDKDWEFKAQIYGETEASFTEKLNDTGEGELKILGTSSLTDWMVYGILEEEDVHIRVIMPGKEWTGKAESITDMGTENGVEYVTIKFLHDYEHIKKMICYSNPIFPAEFQWPKIFLWAGPSIFGIKTLIFLNLLRRFGPLWALPENIFDPQSWLDNLDPNNWPIIVLPGDFFGDTSMWTVLTTRFGNLHDVISPTLKDAGLQLTAKRWFPGMPQPMPGWTHLTKCTLVLDIEDKSGVRGITGTVFDGLQKLVAHIAEDGIEEIIDIVDPGAPPSQYNEIGYLGTRNEWPWVSFRSGMRTGLTGISNWQMVVHKALAGAVVTGGHSPEWVNAGIKLLLNAALGYLGALIGNPSLGIGIFEEQVTDVVLAFHRVANNGRQGLMGRGQYGEHWENTGGTGFSVSALQAIRIGMFKTRAYTSYKVSVINGAPYWIGRHFDLGDRVSAEIGKTGYLYMDQVFGLQYSWSRSQDPRWEISIGNDEAEEPPGAMLSRQIEQVRAFVQSLGVDS